MRFYRRWSRTVWTAVRAILVLTVLLGVVYPLVVTGVAQLIFPGQANGLLVKNADGTVVGSVLIGQAFVDAGGNPLPQYFQSRPSAVDYNAAGSGASNQGPENAELITAIEARRTAVAAFNGVSEEAVPPDAVTASGSGLDPDISPEYAQIQINRVATARGLTVAQVTAVVAAHTKGRDLGYLGDPKVNVLELNLALDTLG
jgi:K+-transporting ATPase ATPase C chain